MRTGRDWFQRFGERSAGDWRNMIIVGLILLVLGLVLSITLLWTIGIIVLIVGLIFLILGSAGCGVGGRRCYY